MSDGQALSRMPVVAQPIWPLWESNQTLFSAFKLAKHYIKAINDKRESEQEAAKGINKARLKWCLLILPDRASCSITVEL